MDKQGIVIIVGEDSIKGTLLLSDGVWAFSSDNEAFLTTYPTGMTYSFSESFSDQEREFKTAIDTAFNYLKSEVA